MADGDMPSSRRVARLRDRRQAAAVKHAATAQKAIGYVRVSTDEQVAHGHGLDLQERAIRAFAESQGYELLDVVADPGVSGATRPFDRAGFKRLLEAARGTCSILLVWKFDRLARQIVYAVTAVTELSAQYGLQIRSVTEPIDTATPMGRTIFAVLAGMAEQERHVVTERTWHGRKEKATKGGFAGGGAPFGYRRDQAGGLTVDAAEAAIVKRIFELAGAGEAHAAIARTLNAEGHRTRRGGAWRHGAIGYILDNPKYRGDVEYLFRWSGAEQLVLQKGSHAAIVETEAD
jgi:site-specific DNA recombinase